MSRGSHSLQGRLMVLVIGLVMGIWLIAALTTWRDVHHELDELLDSHLAQAAALLVVQQVGEMGEEEHDIDAPTLHRHARKVVFQVFHEGRLVLRSANAPTVPMLDAAQSVTSGFNTVRIGDSTWRVFATRGSKEDVRVFVGEEASSRDAILWAALRSTLWPIAAALPLLALATWWAVRRGVAPLRSFSTALAERRPDSLRPVVIDDAPSEMKPMLDELNGLFQRIERLMESERRFTADAAHELRTPIAAIRTQAQVALGERDDALRVHALRGTLEGCDRATHLVKQLLILSRLESHTAAATTLVDLSEVVRRVVGEIAPQAIALQQTISLEAETAAQVRGDATLLSVLVRNLVDNAVRYSLPHATVNVALRTQPAHVVLSVEDSGPGMSEPEIRRLGERFFRGMGTDQAGSGLGWSIVRRVADVHGAIVHVARSESLGGLRVEVVLPVARE